MTQDLTQTLDLHSSAELPDQAATLDRPLPCRPDRSGGRLPLRIAEEVEDLGWHLLRHRSQVACQSVELVVGVVKLVHPLDCPSHAWLRWSPRIGSTAPPSRPAIRDGWTAGVEPVLMGNPRDPLDDGRGMDRASAVGRGDRCGMTMPRIPGRHENGCRRRAIKQVASAINA